jgi:hypothetical protein
VNTPALAVLEARKMATGVPGLGKALVGGLHAGLKSDPAGTLQAIGNTAAGVGGVVGGIGSVAAPVVANMTAPGAPKRDKNQTGSFAPMPAG